MRRQVPSNDSVKDSSSPGRSLAIQLTRAHSSAHSETGLSLLETLISMVLLSFIAIGLLPLMTNSIRQNSQAGAYTTSSNWSRTTLEEFSQLPFDNARLVVPIGNTQSSVTEFWEPATSTWVAGPVTPIIPGSPTDLESSPWRRVVVVEQFGLPDAEDNGVFDSPLDGAVPAYFVQWKRITVTIDRPGERLLDRTPPITLTLMKGL
ncbi:MAG: hypothetical protein K8J08_04355 [Thermoanaerobaculia bacterium]|nr:hypothetical protein [Thermoanaerobaculia bacterium]